MSELLKGWRGGSFKTLGLFHKYFEKRQNRNLMVGELRLGRCLSSVMPWGAEPDSFYLKWRDQRMGFICWVCRWRYSAACFRWLQGWFLLACESAWISCTSKTNPLFKPWKFKCGRQTGGIFYHSIDDYWMERREVQNSIHRLLSFNILGQHFSNSLFATCSIWKMGEMINPINAVDGGCSSSRPIETKTAKMCFCPSNA